MNIVSANQIKQYGVSAIEKKLKEGPVHVLKHNQPLFVAMSETDYENLQAREPSLSAKWLSDVKAMAKHERLHPEEYADLYSNEDWK